MTLYLRQATQVLMYCNNNFRRFVSEILSIRRKTLALKDISTVIEHLKDQDRR